MHVAGYDKSKAEVDAIMTDISQNRRLLINDARWGTAAFAFPADRIPAGLSLHPAVRFTVDADRFVVELKDFGTVQQILIRGTQGRYVPIEVIELLNWP